MMASAFDGASELRFLVITFPAFENSLSLGTEVAGTARRRRATAATAGNFGELFPHQVSGHSWRPMGGSARYRSSSRRARSRGDCRPATVAEQRLRPWKTPQLPLK